MSKKRQELIDTAIRLFGQHGFHATGIDWIAEEANVSKKTMYQHFRSKDELIVAALKHHDGLFRNFFMRAVEDSAETPYERLIAIFDVAHAWFSQHDFYGCMFINAIGEYSNKNTAIQQTCIEFKRLMSSYIEELANLLAVENPVELASELAILLEGSIVTAQVSRNPNAASTAKKAAKILIDNEMK
ncbi:MAG: TetR family transcriptional regulator [Gammaproteobacteria bacterium]|nr:TetR family transcriptional regulator [Gammaproteobacteria bacterium]